MELGDDQVLGQNIVPEDYAPRTLSSELAPAGKLPVEECLREIHNTGRKDLIYSFGRTGMLRFRCARQCRPASAQDFFFLSPWSFLSSLPSALAFFAIT